MQKRRLNSLKSSKEFIEQTTTNVIDASAYELDYCGVSSQEIEKSSIKEIYETISKNLEAINKMPITERCQHMNN